MEFAKKMILVDPRIIEKLTSARDNVSNNIENEMDTVLKSDIPYGKKKCALRICLGDASEK